MEGGREGGAWKGGQLFTQIKAHYWYNPGMYVVPPVGDAPTPPQSAFTPPHTLLVCADHRYTQGPSPTASTF